jgi:cytochrome P450
MLRDLPSMVTDSPGYLLCARRRWGDVVSFPLPRSAVWFVDSPESVRRVLVGNASAYGKRTAQYDALSLVTGEGLLTADPPTWREHRRVVQPAFHASGLPGVVTHSVRAAYDVAAEWAGSAGGTVDVDAAMLRASLQVVGRALFGADLRGEATRLVAAVLTALDAVVARARSPWLPPPAVPTPRNLRVRRSQRTLDASVAAMVARRRARPDPGDDVLALLLAAADGTGGFDDRAVRDEVVTLLVAGHETVASALTWTWWLLAAHPEVQDRLHVELDAVLGGRPPGWDDWPRLEWTRAVVDEALRLFPPAWVVTRRAVEPDVLGGFALPAGATVILSPWTLHRRPGEWPEPERFDPGRWVGERRRSVLRSAYLPFGAGSRLCIGRDFALVEAVAVLAVLGQRYRVAPVPGPWPRVDAGVTLRPRGGLRLRLTRRAGREGRDRC